MKNPKYTIDVSAMWARSESKGGDLSVQQLGTMIAGKMKTKLATMLAFDSDDYDESLEYIVDGLENITGYDDVSPTKEFDDLWSDVYDWADANRVWIVTR